MAQPTQQIKNALEKKVTTDETTATNATILHPNTVASQQDFGNTHAKNLADEAYNKAYAQSLAIKWHDQNSHEKRLAARAHAALQSLAMRTIQLAEAQRLASQTNISTAQAMTIISPIVRKLNF